jgi:hypothetical protein
MAVKKAVKKTAVKKKAAPAPKVTLSAEEIEKQLTLVHKMLARASLGINIMLTRRRLSPTRITESAAETRAASDHMQRLVALLEKK